MTVAEWMLANLTTQGYSRADVERRRLGLALRFSTGTCLALVVVALALASAPMVFGLAAIGLIAGFAPRHPFDYVWNHAVRHVTGGPPLPPNPTAGGTPSRSQRCGSRSSGPCSPPAQRRSRWRSAGCSSLPAPP